MEFVKIKVSDVDVLLPFAKEVFHHSFFYHNKAENYNAYVDNAFTTTQFLKEIENEYSHFYWILEEGVPMAWLKLNEAHAFTETIDDNGLEIQRIYVSPSYQSKGLGHQLLTFSEQFAIDKGLDFIWLGVWEHNTNAIRFYEKNGYVIASSHEFVFGDEVQTDYIMIKNISK
jgi:diamine N-acetyltransferase